MDYAHASRAVNIPFPRLGIGTWGMGGKYECDDSTVENSIKIIELGLSLGLKIIDTAEIYGAGLSEVIVGKAVKGLDRSDVFIISKVWKTNLEYSAVLRAAEKSLERLDTSYIDLYLVHWPNKSVPVSETMRAMERLQREGAVKSIGVSNFSVQDMREAALALTATRLAANQIEYNVLKQGARNDIIPFCKTQAMDVIAYKPLARGEVVKPGTSKLRALAQKYGRTENQIALNWLLTEGTVPIPATMNADHMRENAGALDFTLTDADAGLLCKS